MCLSFGMLRDWHGSKDCGGRGGEGIEGTEGIVRETFFLRGSSPEKTPEICLGVSRSTLRVPPETLTETPEIYCGNSRKALASFHNKFYTVLGICFKWSRSPLPSSLGGGVGVALSGKKKKGLITVKSGLRNYWVCIWWHWPRGWLKLRPFFWLHHDNSPPAIVWPKKKKCKNLLEWGKKFTLIRLIENLCGNRLPDWRRGGKLIYVFFFAHVEQVFQSRRVWRTAWRARRWCSPRHTHSVQFGQSEYQVSFSTFIFTLGERVFDANVICVCKAPVYLEL